MGSVYTLMVLSIIRCIIVCYPTKASFISKRISTLSIIIVWVFAIIITIPPLIGWGEFVPESTGLTYVFKIN